LVLDKHTHSSNAPNLKRAIRIRESSLTNSILNVTFIYFQRDLSTRSSQRRAVMSRDPDAHTKPCYCRQRPTNKRHSAINHLWSECPAVFTNSRPPRRSLPARRHNTKSVTKGQVSSTKSVRRAASSLTFK